jgi:ATP-dependent DNA ligase
MTTPHAAPPMGLEGIVSKRRDAPYRSGTRSEWVKVKTKSWRRDDRERWRLFETARTTAGPKTSER